MLWIEYGPVVSHLCGDNRRELREAKRILDKELSVWIDGAIFSPQYQMGTWDGRQRFFSLVSGKFQSGLLSAVVRHLLENDLYVEIQNYPEPFQGYADINRVELQVSKTETIAMDIEDPQRGYQLEAARQVLKWHRGIIKLATNGGKTEVAAALMKILQVPTIIIVPSRELLHQTAERLEQELGVKVGQVGNGKWLPNTTGITVAMFQTLHKKRDKSTLSWFSNVKLLVCDECHLIMAKTYQKCVQRINAEYRVGLSATPFERDLVKRLTVTGLLGPILAAVNNSKLMDKGVSVAPSVLLLETQISKKDMLELNLAEYDVAITECTTRNHLIAALAKGFYKSNRQCMIMVTRMRHAELLHKLIPGSMVVTSKSGNRDEAKDMLSRGDIFCCITTLFDTGLSVDYIEAMIMASGGMSASKLLQRIGRTVRKAKDIQKDLWIVDFFDHYNRYTRRHSRARRKIYDAERAFKITENLSDAPPELLDFITPDLVNSKHLQRPLAL